MSDGKKHIVTQAESASWVAPLPDDKKPVEHTTKKCIVCGKPLLASHQEERCLRAEVIRLRAEVARLTTMLRLERAGREPGPKQEIEPKR